MKPKNLITGAALITAALAATTAQGKVTLPPVFADNMVLQQQSQVKLRGEAKPNAKVKVRTSWDGAKQTVQSDATGRWSATVTTPAATLIPQTITLSDGEETRLDNVLIGEVWFCSGQSNMEMPMKGFDRQPLTGTNDLIARAKPSVPIRMFISDNDKGRWIRQCSTKPEENSQGAWVLNTPEDVCYASAAAYYFAQYLHDVLEVPVGVIISTLGGSKIEAWMGRESLNAFPEIDTSIVDNNGEIKNVTDTPCGLYNAKIAPFFSIPVKGFLWYQGESNRNNADRYGALMTAFAKDLRTNWKNENMPFYFVEIAPFNYEGADKFSAARLREAQASCLKTIPHSGMVSTIDIGNPTCIHPGDKATVGQRLAWLALTDTYGMTGFGGKSPVYDSMEIADGKIYINVTEAPGGLCPMWTSLKGFEIAGEDKVFHPAFAEIETKSCRLAVSSPEVKNPVAVRYAYKNVPEYSVYNTFGLPLVPFRTDNW